MTSPPMDFEDRKLRVDVANRFLAIIATHGSRFFHHNGNVSYFALDERGMVWFHDRMGGRRIWTFNNDSWGPNFSQSRALWWLCKDLRDFIMGRRELPTNRLSRWPSRSGIADPWGAYGADMDLVRRECKALRQEFERYRSGS